MQNEEKKVNFVVTTKSNIEAMSYFTTIEPFIWKCNLFQVETTQLRYDKNGRKPKEQV